MDFIYWLIGAVLFWMIALAGAAVVLMLVVFGLFNIGGVFGYRLVKVDEYNRLRAIRGRVDSCWRWFSGFKDLDVLWDYVLQTENSKGDIDAVRDAYAKLRGTNVYGVPREIAPTDRP